MPYKIYGGLSFYQRKEIKDVIAYFRLVVNPNDEEALNESLISGSWHWRYDGREDYISGYQSWRKSLGGSLRTLKLRTGYK